jgi:hypothetical protein
MLLTEAGWRLHGYARCILARHREIQQQIPDQLLFSARFALMNSVATN